MKIGLFDSGKGIIPFIDEIIVQDKRNEYFLYIDQDNFPYGNKKEATLINILKEVFAFFERMKIDELLIVCNTMSYVYLQNNIFSTFKVRTILEFNLQKYVSRKTLLCTPYLYQKLKPYYNVIDGRDIASLIEEGNIYNIIERIKEYKFSSDVILSCTHYSLAKEIFAQMHKDVIFYSYEKNFISSLPITSCSISLYAPCSNRLNLEKHFINERIKIKYY